MKSPEGVFLCYLKGGQNFHLNKIKNEAANCTISLT
jgi:hypothetical protein